MMKALAKLERAPGLTLTRVKKPEVGHNDILIRIRKTAICGTDIHIWKWDEWAQKTIPVPMHVGHEYVGEIVEIGQEVRGFAVGDRVSGEGHLRILPQLPRRPPPSLPQHVRRGRQSRGRVRGVPGHPGVQRVPDSRRHFR
jgi:NADPH:quinone reductase-like Zn-dependent oxidoreductase